MTQEEKAKAYDDLLVKLQKAKVDNNVCDERYCCVIDDIVPELKDSEDERIRKEIITYLSTVDDKELIPYESWIAWLEKHGEQETDEWKEGNIIRHGGILALVVKGRRAMKSNGELFTVQYPKEWVKAVPNEIECFLNELEKQGEQNLANSAKTCKDEQNPNPCDGCINRRGCINCENGELRETEKKSTAWSEEDENGLSDALWCCKQAASIAKDENDMGNAWYAENWLKSLKDRVQLQPQQEWSEKDEAVLDALIRRFKGDDIYVSPNSAVECLKSLKDKYAWKPSEEHLHWLKWAINRMPDTEIANEAEAVLEDLLEELLKL